MKSLTLSIKNCTRSAAAYANPRVVNEGNKYRRVGQHEGCNRWLLKTLIDH